MGTGRSGREEGPEVWMVKIRPGAPSRPLGRVRRCCVRLLGFDNRVYTWVAPRGEPVLWNPLKMEREAKPCGCPLESGLHLRCGTISGHWLLRASVSCL